MCGKSYLRISSLRKVSEVVAAKIIFSKNDLRLGCKSSDQAIFVPPSRRFWADMAHAFKNIREDRVPRQILRGVGMGWGDKYILIQIRRALKPQQVVHNL